MLSYRHGFHAGNHADLLKHLTLTALLRHFLKKEKAFSYIDSHSGAGHYDLLTAQATKLNEFRSGIEKIWNLTPAHPLVADYLQRVRLLNADGRLHFYPGSPAIALQLLRDIDRACLIELHPTEFQVLHQNFRYDKRVALHRRDAFEGVLALAPPKPSRGLALIDPAYELRNDYERAALEFTKLHHKWPIGTLALWYPILSRTQDRSARLKRELTQAGLSNLLCLELMVKPIRTETGMLGSGMLIVNAPWQLDQELRASLDSIAPLVVEPGGSGVHIKWLVDKA